jgi:hypothetical protein
VGAGDGAIESRLVDLSTGGAAVLLAKAPPLGDVLELSFSLPDDPEHEIPCNGLVRGWRTQGGRIVVGAEFHHLGPRDRERISDWIADRLAPIADSDRAHWRGFAEVGVARVVDEEERRRPALRWAPGMIALFEEVAAHLESRETIFVPADAAAIALGERIYLEVVPPQGHLLFRLLGEVVWAQRPPGPNPGLGIKLVSLTPFDRAMLKATLRHYRDEMERFR